jgi:hypothetical protein
MLRLFSGLKTYSLVRGTDVSEECAFIDENTVAVIVVYAQRNSRIPYSLHYCKIKLWYFEVLTALTLSITVFWDLTPCSRGYYCRNLGETCTLHIQYLKMGLQVYPKRRHLSSVL